MIAKFRLFYRLNLLQNDTMLVMQGSQVGDLQAVNILSLFNFKRQLINKPENEKNNAIKNNMNSEKKIEI